MRSGELGERERQGRAESREWLGGIRARELPWENERLLAEETHGETARLESGNAELRAGDGLGVGAKSRARPGSELGWNTMGGQEQW